MFRVGALPWNRLLYAPTAQATARSSEGLRFRFSGSGTLVRVPFAEEDEAVEFAQAFAGLVSPAFPSERSEGVEVNGRSREGVRQAETGP